MIGRRSMTKDESLMEAALKHAKRGTGSTSPNPLVGAVLAKNGKVIACGYHKRPGGPHAEVVALDKAGRKAKGSELFVNLEPCSHFGRTPPCTERIIKDGVARVVIGMVDPNPINNGRGVKRLRKSGIDVKIGVLEERCKDLNRAFISFVTLKRPYVAIKAAQSLDGKIATFTGNSKWITDANTRRLAHKLRSRADAVLVGLNTIIKDDPLLNVRLCKTKKQPMRIVLDSKLKIPIKSRIIQDKSSRLIIATTRYAAKKRIEQLQKAGVDVFVCKSDNGRVEVGTLLRYLAERDISYLLVEGGGSVIASFLNKRLVDEAFFYISPKIIGGRNAPTSVEGVGVESVNSAIKLNNVALKKINQDILLHGYVHRDN